MGRFNFNAKTFSQFSRVLCQQHQNQQVVGIAAEKLSIINLTNQNTSVFLNFFKIIFPYKSIGND
jgi:hypothetical protein